MSFTVIKVMKTMLCLEWCVLCGVDGWRLLLISPPVWKQNFNQLILPRKTRWWFQTFFIFIPKLGEDFPFDEHIFQMGWFNHQPEKHNFPLESSPHISLQHLVKGTKGVPLAGQQQTYQRLYTCCLVGTGGFPWRPTVDFSWKRLMVWDIFDDLVYDNHLFGQYVSNIS